MLEILKNKLPKSCSIIKLKETANYYTIWFSYDGDQASAQLPKACVPGYAEDCVNRCIITAISSIYMKKNDLVNAKIWLDKLFEE